MRKILLLIAASLALAACGISGQSGIAPPPSSSSAIAPTAQDKALVLAWQSFETAIDAVDVLIATGAIKPGSPKALKIAGGIDKARFFLNAATAERKPGASKIYGDALGSAISVIGYLRAAIKE